MYSGVLPPVALCACLRCHSESKSWGKTDCVCTCDLKFKDGVAYSERAIAARMKDRGVEAVEQEALEIFERVEPTYWLDCECGWCAGTNLRMWRKIMNEFPALSFDQVKNQALGFVYGLGVTVALALAGELSGVESFEHISLAGLGLTAARSAASFVTLFFTQRNVGGR